MEGKNGRKEAIGRLRSADGSSGGRIAAAEFPQRTRVRVWFSCGCDDRSEPARGFGPSLVSSGRFDSIDLEREGERALGAMEGRAAPELPRRCHHCAGPLSKDMETRSWTVPPLVRDSFSMIGSAIGGTAGAFYGFNHAMPVVRRYIKGPMWIHFLVGAPPVIVFSSACAGLAGGTIPALAQLVSSSYHAAMSSPSFARSASHDDMHKSRTSSPL